MRDVKVIIEENEAGNYSKPAGMGQSPPLSLHPSLSGMGKGIGIPINTPDRDAFSEVISSSGL